jgi:hypothetical protein
MYYAENTLTKGHQQRTCVVCREPVIDHQAASINIGGGLEVLVHRACMSELTEALAPQEVRIPVKQPSVRKSTLSGQTGVSQPYSYDQERMARNIKSELYALLLQRSLK